MRALFVAVLLGASPSALAGLDPGSCEWWLMKLAEIEYHEENRILAWERVADGDTMAGHLAVDSWAQVRRIQAEIEAANQEYARRRWWKWWGR